MPSIRESLREQLAEHLGDRYRIVEELGFGGMAVVYLAENTDFGRLVALKVLRPDRQLDDEVAVRFRSEAIAIAQLRHPHIIGIHSRGGGDGLLWFEMDYIEGGSLEERIAGGRVEWRHAARLIAQAADGLHYAHSQGVIHRDIKPSNLLLSPSGTHLTITDFGIAKIIGRTTLTETGVTLGTIAYMSPEQLVAERDLSVASDQFSLGIVAYEALSGARPFGGETAGQARFARVQERPSLVRALCPECPPDLEQLIHRMLAFDPEERWPDLGVVKQAAEEIAVLGEAPSLRGIPVVRRRPRRNGTRLLLAVLLVTTAGLGWYFTAGRWRSAGASPSLDEGSVPSLAAHGPRPALQPPPSGGGDTVALETRSRSTPAPLRPAPLEKPAAAKAVSETRGSNTVRDVVSKDTPPVVVALPPGPAKATLRIASPIPGTFVNINGSSTPMLLREQFQEFEVPAGEVRLLIRQEGCRDRSDIVVLKSGEIRSIRRTAECPIN